MKEFAKLHETVISLLKDIGRQILSGKTFSSKKKKQKYLLLPKADNYPSLKMYTDCKYVLF